MPTRITQIEGTQTQKRACSEGTAAQVDVSGSSRETTLLKVEGSLYLRDAELLEKICREVASQTQRCVTLDLGDLSFLDSDSAAVLCRLKREQGVRLEGLHLFIEKVVELVEESERVARYRP